MYYLNKIVMGLANPMSVGLILLGLALVARFVSQKGSASTWFGVAAFVWLAVWSGPLLMPDFPRRLEQQYPPQRVEELPMADAIVLLGGGMSKNPNGGAVYPEMHESADRVWHAARLWRAGKAPVIFACGTNEVFSSAVLLKDLGVPDQAIACERTSRNTEENARFVAEMLARREKSSGDSQPTKGRPRILLVTSAWHMRRALLMFRKYAPDIEVIPAACDYESLCLNDEMSFGSIFPSVDAMFARTKSLKEIIGYWGYRLLRR